jgi:hypothetical protein
MTKVRIADYKAAVLLVGVSVHPNLTLNFFMPEIYMLLHCGCLCVNFMFCVCTDMTKYATMFLCFLYVIDSK